ncbi:MAG: right-handed parallel beta-helix repeat-containing protein [Thermoplasmata archaeon]
MISFSSTSNEAKAYEQHGYIEIDGDFEFLADDSVIGGNGSADNPYIIADWYVNGSYDFGIYIRNTRAFFVVRGVLIENSNFAAIRIENVSNGRLENSNIMNNHGIGIQLMDSQNISIANCTIINTGSTAILGNSASNVVIESVVARKIDRAIFFECSSAIRISSCTFEDATTAVLSLSRCVGSKVQNSILRNSSFKGMELILVNNTEFFKNAIVNASTGIYLYDCHFLTFHGNMICISRVSQVQSSLSSSIKWNVTYAGGGGNYWSDYIGPDQYGGESQNIPGSDGIIDIPFTILPGYVDAYPLLKPTLQDDIPPTSRAEVIGNIGAGDWFKSFAIVVINSTDDFSGVLNISYSIDSSPYVEYKGSFKVSDSGEHVIRFYATDRMSNQEAPHELVVKVDSAAPSTEIFLSGIKGQGDWYLSSITVLINATDNESGVASIWYSIDASPTVPWASLIVITSDGYHNIVAYSIDAVGNTGEISLAQASIDTQPPELTINEVNGTVFNSPSAKITWVASDSMSGIDHFEVSIDGGSFTRLPAARKQYVFSGLADGTHVATILAFDKAGHVTIKEISFTIEAGVVGLLISNLLTILALIVLVAVIVFALVVRSRRKRRR